MKIILKPGETIRVGFADTDGEVEVSFEEDGTCVYQDGKLMHREPFVPPPESNACPECGVEMAPRGRTKQCPHCLYSPDPRVTSRRLL